jgi:hypothetical protein
MIGRGLLVVAVLLAACGSTAPDRTGLGAESARWRAHHGPAYTDVLTTGDGRVAGFTVSMTPRSLADAEALVRRDLPPGTTAGPAALTVGVEATKCEIVEYTAPDLRAVLGSDRVMAVFSTAAAVTMDTSAIDRAVVVSAIEDYPRAC